MVIDGYAIEPLTPDRFDDLVCVLGAGGIGGCWCMYWALPTIKAWQAGTKGGNTAPNRAALLEMVENGPPPGLIAYDGTQPIAWCRVVPREGLPALDRSRHFKTDLDKTGVWSLPCFVVRRAHRNQGLTEVLVKAAMEFARARGAVALEAYPREPDERVPPSTIYTGVLSTFTRLGFEQAQRSAPHRPMVRIRL